MNWGGVLTADDCDDGDADINPNGIDVAGDGIDQNCDGVDSDPDLTDLDGDGFDRLEVGVHYNFSYPH